ncbi:TPA: DUF1983 domain-containing protein [Enterobacter cloacae]|nr:DUF1983 domain-containing protein [Enterobacter cloacae]HAS1237300.1 DUF1983 domain-containing protein [Enterobacter cloacae]HED1598735.1 DUF1983 domain-containing protein [Enterobacter cloacae subsp. cloacae]HED2541896.1 DUF1983 domain-containing protein [Enterobacter cloacae subsp. cloacae]
MTIGVELDTSDVQKTIDELDDKIRNSDAFKVLKDGWSFEKSGVLIINNGEVFVTDAKIDDAVLSTNYSVKMNVDYGGKRYAAGMALDVDDGKSRVKILAEKLAVAANHQNALETALQQSIKNVVDETIQQAMQPGGAIWTSLRRGI